MSSTGMSKRIKSLLVLYVLGIFTVLSTSTVFADFYVIAGSPGVGTKIKALPYTISSPGFYYLTKDLSCASGTHGITIDADDVTLDLMGFGLVGPGGTGSFTGHDGIYMVNRTNIEIRNGSVRNFNRHGIYNDYGDASGNGHRFKNIRANNNGINGIDTKDKGVTIEGCKATQNGYAGIITSAGSIVNACTAYDNATEGINVGLGSIVKNSTAYSNDGHGIVGSWGSVVSGNASYNNAKNGIEIIGGRATVTNNSSSTNTWFGIKGTNILLDQNVALGNVDGNLSCTSCTLGLNSY